MLNKKKISLSIASIIGVMGCASMVPILTDVNRETTSLSSESNMYSSSYKINTKSVKRDAYLNYNRYLYGVEIRVKDLNPKTIYDWMLGNSHKVIDLINYSGEADEYKGADFENIQFFFKNFNLGPSADYSLFARDIKVSPYVSSYETVYQANVDIFARPIAGHSWVDNGSSTSVVSIQVTLANIKLIK